MTSASVAAQNFATKMQESGLSVNDFIKAQKYSAVSFAAQDKSLTNVRSLLDEYNSGLATTGNICKNTGLAQQDFAKAVGESNRVAGNYLGNLNGGKATMSGYVGSLVSAKLATIGLQAATIALNTAISMGVSLLINLAIKKLDEWIETEEEVAEAAEKAISKYKEAQETLKSNKATIDEISSDYEKLSKGVDKFGNNISLSTSEYKRYHEITNKIAEMFPTMIEGFDSEGNAIISAKGDVEALTEAYKENARIAKTEFLRGASDIYKDSITKGIKADNNVTWGEYLKDFINPDEESADYQKALQRTAMFADEYKRIIKDAGYDIDFSIFDNGSSIAKKIKDAVGKNPSLLINYLKTEGSKKNSSFSEVRRAILTNLEINDSDYQELSEKNKGLVQKLINGLDKDYFDSKSLDDVYADFGEKIKSIFGDKRIASAFEYMSDAQDELAKGKITMGEYQEAITRFVGSLDGLDKETKKYAKISFGLELDKDGISKDYKNVISQLSEFGLDDKFGEGFTESFVNKLSLPEFSQMLNNGGQFKDSITKWLQENQGATAAQFSDWFNSVLSESANSVSDSSSVILNAFDKAATGITEFKNAMDSSKGSIKSGTEAFEGYADAYTNAMKLINEGYDLDNGKLYAYMELLLGKDTLEKYGYNVDKLKGKLSELKGVYGDKNSLGDGFIPKLEKATEKTNGKLIRNGEVIASYNKKTKELNIDNNHFADVAKALGMTEDGLVACIQAMSTWSDVALESLDEIKARAESAGAVYHEQFEGKDVVNVETLRSNMQANGYNDKQTYDAIQQLKKDKNVITIDVKADSSAKDIMGQLSKLGLVGKDGEEKPTLDLMDTIDVLKGTDASLTDIMDMITTLNDSGEISIKVNGETTDDLGVLRDKVEELYNYTALGAERAQKKLLELGLTKHDITFETGDPFLINDYIASARETLNKFRKEDGTIDLSIEGAEEAQTVLIQLINEKQEYEKPAVMNIDTSQFDESQADIKNAIDKVQEFINLKNQLELQTELGIDTTETQKALRSVATQIKDEIPDSVKTDLGLDTEEFDSAIATISNTKINVDTGLSVSDESITSVTAAIKNIPTQNIKVGIDINEEDKTAEVKYNVDSSEVDAYKKKSDDKTATVTYHKVSTEVDQYDPKNLSRTVTYRVKTEGSVEANGTAHVSGTAKAGGDWGTATGGTALVGELGRKNFATLYSDI